MNHPGSATNQQRLDQYAQHITARLTHGNNELPHDISERLRAARVQAVEKHKWVLSQSAADAYAHGHSSILIASHSSHHSNWWGRLGAVGLLLTLILGLLTIDIIKDETGARELAEIDSAILTDDLPPAAYIDAGFVQFLKTHGHQEP
jgi:hypothetical protein